MSNIDSLIVQANNLLLLLRKSTKLTPVSGDTHVGIDPYAASQINTLIKVAIDIRDLYICTLARAGIKKKDIANSFDIPKPKLSMIINKVEIDKNTMAFKQALNSLIQAQKDIEKIRDESIVWARGLGVAVEDIAEKFDVSLEYIHQLLTESSGGKNGE